MRNRPFWQRFDDAVILAGIGVGIIYCTWSLADVALHVALLWSAG